MTEAAKITFAIKVKKSITLTDEDCEREHFDDVLDVVSYFYNIDKEKMEYEKGGEENIDIIELSSKRIGDNLVIILQVAGLIDSSKTYSLFLVKSGHTETTDFYKPGSTNIYDTLYKPNSTIMYGEIPSSYRKINEDTITYTINLGDLEAGDIDGWTGGLESDFDLFAVAKGRETERYEGGLYSVVSYESAGLGAAYPGEPPETSDDDSDEEESEFDEMMLWTIIIIIVVVVIVVMVVIIRQKKGGKADIDYTGGDYRAQDVKIAEQPSQDIPTLFQSPFEQQFGGPGQQPAQLDVRATQQPGYMAPGTPPGQAAGGVPPPMPQQQQPQATKTCPNCKKNIVASTRMCPYCGGAA
jgi:ABC-type cobalt transport system substrate-binding protein